MKKRLFSILIVTILLFGVISVDAAGDSDFLIENGVLILYTGKAANIVIPKGVTVIGEETFLMKDIVSITMPDSVIVIGDDAFSLCKSLKKVVLSKNLRSIGNGAFSGCSKIKSISLPYGLKRIGNEAFNECTSLIDMNIPATVTYIGSRDSLPMNWTKNQKQEFVVLGDGILYKYNGCYGNGEDVIIPGNVKTICEYAFSYDYLSNVNMKSITIPGSVKEVRKGAFYKCSDNLKKVAIGEGVMSIAEDAFSYCPSLTQINIPKSLSDTSLVSYRAEWSVNHSDKFDIRGNGVLLKYKGTDANVIIPNGVKHIYSGAFEDNRTLQTVTIPQSVESIGDAAFMNCSRLAKVDIPSGVKSIGEMAFYNCSNLESINIPRGVTSIEERTFYGCSSLKQIDIPDTVKSIGQLAFAKAGNLGEVRIANGLNSIEHYAFTDCRSLNGVIIPPSVTYIGNMAFQNNTDMRDITIQNPNVRVHENINFQNSFSGSRNVIITASAGGSVQRMANRNKIIFKAIPDGKNSPVIPRSTTVLVNGMKVDFEAYTINTSTYFKLRDLAAALNGTKKQFNVAWDASLGAITLTSGTPYKAVGGELSKSNSKAKSMIGTTCIVYKDRKKLTLFTYQIDGNSYFKLRDIMQCFDVGVKWDRAAGAISIDTSAGYVQ